MENNLQESNPEITALLMLREVLLSQIQIQITRDKGVVEIDGKLVDLRITSTLKESIQILNYLDSKIDEIINGKI